MRGYVSCLILLRFPAGSAVLSGDESLALEAFLRDALQEGRIKKIDLIAWTKGKHQTSADRKLAGARLLSLREELGDLGAETNLVVFSSPDAKAADGSVLLELER
jgi:hypothetical protein